MTAFPMQTFCITPCTNPNNKKQITPVSTPNKGEKNLEDGLTRAPPEYFQGWPDPCSPNTIKDGLTRAPPGHFEANFSYGYETLKPMVPGKFKQKAFPTGKPREATGTEPKARPWPEAKATGGKEATGAKPKARPKEPILNNKARTPKSKLGFLDTINRKSCKLFAPAVLPDKSKQWKCLRSYERHDRKLLSKQRGA